MLTNFFFCLREHGVPCTLREHMDLLQALDRKLVYADVEEFYSLARVMLVKDEKYFDKFDRAFGAFINGIESEQGLFEALIPDEWLRAEFLRQLSDEEKAKIESLGGLDKLIEEFKKRLEEQKERHQGGNKWIGTGGTSPFGNSGYHPNGIRVGGGGGNRSAAKVWERREFSDLDDSIEIGTRNIKVALRRLRRFARSGAREELDLDDTISSTARNAGLLDIKMVPERHNAVKVLIFFDVGGSMNPYVRVCEELFSAARSEFKHLEYYYFHNCPYESLWRNNYLRHTERIPTWDVIHKYSHDYKVIFVGDAAMAPWELTHSGGSIEHFNEESGAKWIERIVDTWDKIVWINPQPPKSWQYTHSTEIIYKLLDEKMYPLTVKGLEQGMAHLAK